MAATASKPINRTYSSIGLTAPLLPPSPRVNMLLSPVLSTVSALAICDPLLVLYVEIRGATVTVVLALTVPSLLVAVSV